MSGNWVDDFSAIQGSGAKPGLVKKPASRKEHIEAELKLLEWHKLANEAAIKAALMHTKNIKEVVPEKAPLHSTEDARWMKKVIESEHVKPLQVSKQYVLEYESKEKENAERLTSQVERHISTLRKLREKLEDKNSMKTRIDEYRTWKSDFHDKKHAVMLGKTVNEFSQEKQGLASSNEYTDDFEVPSRPETVKKGGQELSTVLDSLNKLAELERRITSLEKDNQYEQLLERERPNVNGRVNFEFRAEKANEPEKFGRGVMYSVKKKIVPNAPPSQNKPVGAGAAAVRAKQRAAAELQKIKAKRSGAALSGGGGFFLTDVLGGNGAEEDEDIDEEERRREEKRRERQRDLALASAGKLNIRNRVASKKARAKEQDLGNKKHELAMKEIQRRRADVQNQKKKPLAGSVVPGKGAASGIKTNNKYMQAFAKEKAANQKKKEMALKPAIANDRLASHSAPARSNANLQNNAKLTRRTNAPTRRPQADSLRTSNAPKTAPIIVSGVGGLKALRNQPNR